MTEPSPRQPRSSGARLARDGILGVVLAGGRSLRMGAEKAFVALGGRPLIAHAVDRLRPQVGEVIVNANGDPARFDPFGLTVVADTVAEHPGPLAGLLAAMAFARARRPDVSHVAMVPVDTPFLALDLVDRLAHALSAAPSARVAFAATPRYRQPVFALADLCLFSLLERDILAGSAARVGDWLQGQPHVETRFDDEDAFFNINTVEDLAGAEARLAP